MPASHSRYRRADDLLKMPINAHPQYRAYQFVWRAHRDAVQGEDAIKERGIEYLPKMSAADEDDYKDFLARAVWVNMTSRTKAGLLGSVFRRKPSVSGVSDTQAKRLKEKFTDDGNDLQYAAERVFDEVLEVGRIGALLDRDSKGQDAPYISLYLTENILDWETEKIDGRRVLTRVALREGRQQRASQYAFFDHRVLTSYRVLILDLSGPKPIYRQHLYFRKDGDAEISGPPDDIVTPVNRGRTFDRIPFEFFGPMVGGADIEKPPLRDIVTLNFAHYRDYAQLQHGRYHTALPIYYAPTAGENKEYVIGPNVVWQINSEDDKPGILEFHGHGLNSLETSLKEKEKQIAALGGRMITNTENTASLSDNEMKMKEANESSMLLNIVRVVNRSMTRLVRLWVMWDTGAARINDGIEVELNTDFLLNHSGAREFRAIHAMYMDGVIPVEVVYDYLLKSDVIPEHLTLDEFKKLLDNADSFPNQPDIDAKREGFSDAKDRSSSRENDKDRKSAADLAQKAQETARVQAESQQNQPPPAAPNEEP